MKKYLLTLSSLALSLGMTHAAEGVIADPATNDTVIGGGSVVEVADPFAAMTLGAAEMPVSSLAGGFLLVVSPAIGAESDVFAAAAAAADVSEANTAEEGAADVSEANADVLAPPAAVEINTSEEGAAAPAAEEGAEVVPVKKKKVRKPDARDSDASVSASDEESSEESSGDGAAPADAAAGMTRAQTAGGDDSDADGVAGDDNSNEGEGVAETATDAPELPNSN